MIDHIESHARPLSARNLTFPVQHPPKHTHPVAASLSLYSLLKEKYFCPTAWREFYLLSLCWFSFICLACIGARMGYTGNLRKFRECIYRKSKYVIQNCCYSEVYIAYSYAKLARTQKRCFTDLHLTRFTDELPTSVVFNTCPQKRTRKAHLIIYKILGFIRI